jgi:hypothetical protein
VFTGGPSAVESLLSTSLLEDRPSQLAIGLFAATFTDAILTLRQVDDQRGSVPGLSVLVAYGLMIASIISLILYVHHAGQSLRAVGLIDLVGDNLRRVLDERYPADGTGPPDRRPALDRQLRLLEAATRRELADEEDVGAAVTPDEQGIGSGADLVALEQPPSGDTGRGRSCRRPGGAALTRPGAPA